MGFDFFSSISTISGLVHSFKKVKRVLDTDTPITQTSLDSGNYQLFEHSGKSVAEIREDVRVFRGDAKRLARKTIFYAEIQRVAPVYDSDRAKQISRNIESFDITFNGVELTEQNVGSAFYNHMTGTQSGSIGVTFREFKQGFVMDFLTRVSPLNIDGVNNTGLGTLATAGLQLAQQYIPQVSNVMSLFSEGGRVGAGEIVPKDGTFLLPYDHYYNIVIYTIENDLQGGTQYRNYIIDDEFMLEGSPSTDMAVGEDGFRTVSATFKPIKSWR